MGNSIGYYLNNLIIKNRLLTEDELKDFQPFIINKFLYYSGFHNHAIKFNKFVFSSEKYLIYKIMFYTLPKILYFNFNYIKKDIVQEYEDFYLEAISQYFKVSKEKAKDYASIFEKYPEKKKKFISMFPFTKKEFLKLGLDEESIIKSRFNKKVKTNKWW